MPVISGFFNIVILLGAIQGFILSGLLFFSARARQSSRLLAVLIFLMALASMNLYLLGQKWIDSSLVLVILTNVIPMIIVMPLGPLIYFYIRSVADPAFVFNRKYRVHFYPAVIDLVPQLTTLIYLAGRIPGWIKMNDASWGHFIDNYNVYSDIPRWLSLSIYLWISARYLAARKTGGSRMAYGETLAAGSGPIAGAESVNVKWLQQFIRVFMVFQSIWLLYLIPYVIPAYTDRLLDSVNWYPVYIPMAILIYWLGIKGWLVSQSHFFPVDSVAKKESPVALPDALLQRTVLALRKAMEEDKLYLDPGLQLSLLAAHTGIPQKSLSAVLNQHIHKSFNEFINEYRVYEIKERLMKPASKNLTIAGLAYECGFNSQPTFQRAFKAIVGVSPKEFLSQNLTTDPPERARG